MKDSSLYKSLKELVHLHMCEQEGISSGQPTKEQWLKAVDNASEALASHETEPPGGEDGEFATPMDFIKWIAENSPDNLYGEIDYLQNTARSFLKQTTK